MSWIKAWAEGSFSLFSGNILEAFQPLDFFHFYGLWYDLWIKRFLQAAEKLGAEQQPYKTLQPLLSTPSNLRAMIQKTIPAYLGTANPNQAEFRRFTNFFARMLAEACPSDPFGKSATPLHTKREASMIVKNIAWEPANPNIARLLGQLITAAGSLVHGLYNDLVTDFGWDAYGPYKIKKDESLLIRHFPQMRPKELWDKKYLGSAEEILIYGLYESVEWEIGCVGCHTIVKNGNPITGLKRYAVVADGKKLDASQISRLIAEFSLKAEAIYQAIRKKDFEELKRMVLLQECYQLKKFFEAAKLPWRPDHEMLKRIKNRPLLSNILPRGKMMTSLKQYEKEFRLKRFAKEVLSENL